MVMWSAIAQYPAAKTGKTGWPVSGLQPLNHVKHGTRIIAEAMALLEIDKKKRQKIPSQIFESFIGCIITFVKKGLVGLWGLPCDRFGTACHVQSIILLSK